MSSTLKFIYFFAYYNTNSPSVRYRGQYPLEYFKKKFGTGFYLVIPGYDAGSILQFLRAYISAFFFRKNDSMIIIQRINSNFIYANLLKLLVKRDKKNTVYDIDDADYLEFPVNTINYFLKNCEIIATGSRELSENLQGFNKTIINTSPVPDLEITRHKKNELLTIGWIGGFGGDHKRSLMKYFFPALSSLPFKVKLIIMGVMDDENNDELVSLFSGSPGVYLEIPRTINWKDEREIQTRISEFDLGIATLMDTESQRSKSAFKLKQYMNNGVPVLSSDIPENNVFLNHGVNGYFCSTTKDFTERIVEFNYMSETAYTEFSKNARLSVDEFNHENYYKILLGIFNKSYIKSEMEISDKIIISSQ